MGPSCPTLGLHPFLLWALHLHPVGRALLYLYPPYLYPPLGAGSTHTFLQTTGFLGSASVPGTACHCG